MAINRRIVLASRPQGRPSAADFRLEEAPVPEPGPDQVLCRTIYLSLDPYMRGRMSDAASYAQAGADRPGHGRRHRRPGGALQPGRFRARRLRGRTRRLAGVRAVRRGRGAEGRSEARADLDRARRARHAGSDRLRGPARDRQAQARRDAGGGRGRRPGRLDGRPDREDQGLPRGRHRRLRSEVRVREGRARLRCLSRSPRTEISRMR